MSTAKKLAPHSTPQVAGKPEYNNRILIVDDEGEILTAYKNILEPKGNVVSMNQRSSRSKNNAKTARQRPATFEVVTTVSAQEALDLVKKSVKDGKPFAMGFFDVVLGGQLDGIDLVKKIREIDPKLYAVFVTAYNDRSIDNIQSALGTHESWDYLNKPFSDGEILQKARNATAFWNLMRDRDLQEARIESSNRKVIESERLTSVSTIARGVGHEFGNLLVQVMGRADLGRTGTMEEMKNALEAIYKASETASEILEKFKNLSKPSESIAKKTLIQASEPIETALALLHHQFKTQNIEVEWLQCDETEILASSTSLVQVTMNLLINAIHALGDKGGKIQLTLKNTGKAAEMVFRDSGSGISPDLMERIFDPFFTTKKDKGTGLGLAICKEIIELEHGGELSVRNHPEGGAEFKIVIPFEDEGDQS